MKKLKVLVTLMLCFACVSQVCANHSKFKTIDSREIRKTLNRSEHKIEDESEPPTEDLVAELRMPKPLATSEVIQLLGDDETRSHELNQSSKPPGSSPLPSLEAGRMDCSKITMQIFQVLLQNPDSVEPEDYSCGLLNLISHFEKSHGRIRSLEASLHSATSTIKTLETNFQVEMSKAHFLMKEMNETLHKETERAIKAENVIARRVLSEKARVDGIQKNMTELLSATMVQIKDFEVNLKDMEKQWHQLSNATTKGFSPAQPQPPPANQVKEEDLKNIETKLVSLHDFIKDLSGRIANMEDGSDQNVNKGITQIFKTYASLANEIEKETERAKGEEGTLKTLITTEISSLGKQIHALQERITEEKNRVQIIENRRTADLFEEINRAKSEETRLGQRLKEDMSKAAAAFKRLEAHVDIQMNSTKLVEIELRVLAENATKKAIESEERLTEQMNFERTRAASIENVLKAHLDTEVTRAMKSEDILKSMITEERARALAAEHELKIMADGEQLRAKGVEKSIAAQLTVETERTKLERERLKEDIRANVTRLLTELRKESTRAQSAEKEIDDKIAGEVVRAMGIEQGLLANLNSEESRANGKELELYTMIKTLENSTKVLDQMKSMLEEETSRAQKAESSLKGHIDGEIIRAKDTEENIRSVLTAELEHFKILEQNLTDASLDVVKHTKELELEVRKTVMAEVARAVDSENALKQQLANEVERATLAEKTISSYQSANYTECTTKLNDLSQEMDKDTGRLEDITLQISRNLTGDLLTLAELFDDKLDDLERSENVRLKKLEEDMKKCCSGSSWRWRTPPKGKSQPKGGSRSEGVISKIMQVFGALPEAESTKKTKASSKRKVEEEEDDEGEGRAISSAIPFVKEDTEEKEPSEDKPIERKPVTMMFTEKVRSSASPIKNETVHIVYGNAVSEISTALRPPDRVKSSRRRTNRRENTQTSRSNGVSVQTANSRVTSTYG